MPRHRIRNAIIVTCLGALVVPGCSRSASEEAAAPTPPAAAVQVPSALFVSSAPANAVPLIDAKAAAKPGDEVVFEARIGGRREPFVKNRAVFFVADPSLLDCDQLHPGTCKAPWDYCCEPRESLLKHMGTVQIVDAGGQPLKASLHDEHGLLPQRTVFVRGTVDQNDESGNFVVNADAIFVKEG